MFILTVGFVLSVDESLGDDTAHVSLEQRHYVSLTTARKLSRTVWFRAACELDLYKCVRLRGAPAPGRESDFFIFCGANISESSEFHWE